MDDAGRVMLIRQYRHAVGDYLWELPGRPARRRRESSLDAARRELPRRSASLRVTGASSSTCTRRPGPPTRPYRIYLARGLSDEGGRTSPRRADEESDLTEEWVDLDEALARVLAGDITNGLTVAGVLAAAHARGSSYRGLRPADAPWPARRP
jgi:ADP-ribose pyrophosphatase